MHNCSCFIEWTDILQLHVFPMNVDFLSLIGAGESYVLFIVFGFIYHHSGTSIVWYLIKSFFCFSFCVLENYSLCKLKAINELAWAIVICFLHGFRINRGNKGHHQPSKGPLLTNTTLTVLRHCGKYLQMSRLLRTVAMDVIICFSQLFQYYLYAVHAFFTADHVSY